MALALIANLGCALAVLTPASAQVSSPPPARYNVLFVVVDDLRPELGAYGKAYMHTPHIDSLAARGMVFERAYAQAPICSPSRMSFLTGMRVSGTDIRRNNYPLRARHPDIVTLPQRFRDSGYRATAHGKVFHGTIGDSLSWDRYDDSPHNRAVYQLAKNRAVDDKHDGEEGVRGRPYEGPDVPDSVLSDGLIAKRSIADLHAFPPDAPFFQAFGPLKPHLPFIAPRRYWDLYPAHATSMYARVRATPAGAPPYAMHDNGETRNYYGVPAEGPFDAVLEDSLARGYAAAVSYADAQVGRVLAALEATGRADSTIVVLFGDHGYRLGDLDHWGKNALYELDLRVPLVIVHPDLPPGRSEAIVELVDLYPTLLEMTGLAPPTHQLDGESLLEVWGQAAPGDGLALAEYSKGDLIGVSVRDARYRLTEWRRGDDLGEVVDLELYDYEADGGIERLNRAGEPDYAEVEMRLREAVADYVAEAAANR